MADSRKIVRIFLGSPGDLGEERRSAKAVIDEFNTLWSDNTGYHVELVGWEDTVASYGRPQAIVNQDLEKCELFVGMIWKRWGTPPDTTGVYSSGFEEELEKSIGNRKSRGEPDISLLFKKIDRDALRDPGEQLKKVLALKDSIIAKKELYFEEFENIEDFKEKFRRRITRYVQALQISGARQPSAENINRPKKLVNEHQALAQNMISEDGSRFLQNIVSSIETKTTRPTAIEVARFRLLGVILRVSQNDELVLGVHDANLLFLERDNINFGLFELYGLIESGLANFQSKSTPLWYWLRKIDLNNDNKILAKLSLFGTPVDRIGALQAMRYLGEPLPDEEGQPRDTFLASWLSKNSSNELKTAALAYLGDCGRVEDLTAIRSELDIGNHQTTYAAVDAILRIYLRYSHEKAIRALIELQAESIAKSILESLFENGSSIDAGLLIECLSHRNAEVRRLAIATLGSEARLTMN